MRVTLDNSTVIALVINNNAEDPSCVDVLHSFGGNKDKAVEAIMTYFSNGIQAKDELIVEAMDVFISAIESLKIEYPQLAAQVRKTTIEYIKKKRNDQNPQL